MSIFAFKYIVYDRISIPLGSILKEKYHLFERDATGEGTDIHSENEAAIVKWLFSRSDFKSLVLAEIGCNINSDVLVEVKEPLVKSRQLPGDFDLLILQRGSPHFCIAVEVKQVKVWAETGNQDNRSKFEKKLQKVIAQATGLVQHGFHQSFVCILMAVNGSPRTEDHENIFYSGASTRTFQLIRDRLTELHESVGIILIEIVQPTKKAFAEMGMVGVHLAQPAKPRPQEVELTNRIKALYASEELLARYLLLCSK